MEALGRCIKGDFKPQELKRYVVVEALLFWGLIALVWNLYPTENRFSIMTHTFSFLGAFAEKHNPKWWWIFSIAMTSWGLATMPLALYHGRRFASISKWGARIGTGLFIMGCIGTIGVAAFPDDRMIVFGDVRMGKIHTLAALIVAAGYTFGILWYGALLIKNAIFKNDPAFIHHKFIWPYLFWTTISGTGIYFQIKAGEKFENTWSEGMNTIYSFQMWENLLIYTLYAFLIWFTLVLPNAPKEDT